MAGRPGSRGGRPADDLISVLRLVCSALPAAKISARLGTVRAPAEPGEPTRVEPTRYASLRAIDYLPWTDEDFGLVELQLADPEAWRITELAAALGSLEPVVLPDSGARSLAGEFEEPSLPAWAAVYLNLARPPSGGDERIESITIRTESPEPEDD